MLRIAIVSISLCCALLPAARASADSVFLEELTWTEVRTAQRAGKTTVIIPVGGTEQNGPHMELGKHNFRVRALAARIATALGDAVVAPVLAYVPEGSISPPSGHMRFPGTISIPDVAFQSVLEAAAKSFKQNGFTDVVLIGDSGNYQGQLKAVAVRLNRAWAATPARAHFIDEYYRAAQSAYAQALRAKGLSDAQIGTHAGAADTALLMALDPARVRTDRLDAAHTAGASAGVTGDPRAASASLGQLGVDLIVADTVNAIRRSRKSSR
ncbi:MAG: creatininase family protein [Burkholderiaceae bacterium]